MTQIFDIAIIGAGIAGASVAARLAGKHSVIVLEMEERPGYHSTGRSAAAFEPNYGPATIRALTRASRELFFDPPKGFSDAPLVLPRETVFVAPADQDEAFERLLAESQGLREIDPSEARRLHPKLRDGYAKRAVLDRGTADLDVDLIHRGFLRQIKDAGAQAICNAEVTGLKHGSHWTIATRAGTFHARTVVNASGAWASRISAHAGAAPIAIQPKRRSIAVVPAPDGEASDAWPLIGDVGETWYCKPQSGKLLVSPADAAPVDPHDAFADDMTLAEGIERFQEAMDIEVTRVEHTWGGLRSFAADGNPVCGYDAVAPRFFWLAGQGGYGIQTAPALSLLAAALIDGGGVPQSIADEGFDPAAVSPLRFG
ncbi:MAG: FAD-binding oxidoreductase [Rhizobiales bacterium]|nr:FAD-binding oxidoreductase [Hyphomicrobiales bacterium]